MTHTTSGPPVQRQVEIHLRLQAIRVYKYSKIQGPWFQRNYIIARDKKIDLHDTSFQSSPKINCMLITRSICIQWKLMQPLIIAVLLIKILLSFFSTTLVFTWFKVTNAFKWQNLWTDLFWKSSKFNFSYKAFLAKHMCMATVKQWFLFPVSTVSARNAWDYNRLFLY